MRKIFYYVLMLFIVLVVITCIIVIDKKVDHKPTIQDERIEKLAILDNIDKRIDYFKYQNLDRYIAYYEKYPYISKEDIITRVNLNLDFPFYENTKQSNLLNKTNILVNKYIYLPNDYAPNNLIEISKDFSNSTKELVYEAKVQFEKMASDAKEKGYTIRAISAYRSYSYQENLYNNYVLKDGKDLADTYSARPGYSEHQTGLVVDIDNGKVDYNNFEQTEEFIWMQDNSYKYGFILRYPKDKENITGYSYESWHYRYVGKEIAKYIYENKITFDEYYIKFLDK